VVQLVVYCINVIANFLKIESFLLQPCYKNNRIKLVQETVIHPAKCLQNSRVLELVWSNCIQKKTWFKI